MAMIPSLSTTPPWYAMLPSPSNTPPPWHGRIPGSTRELLAVLQATQESFASWDFPYLAGMGMLLVLVGTAALLIVRIDWEALMLDIGEPLEQLPAAPADEAAA